MTGVHSNSKAWGPWGTPTASTASVGECNSTVRIWGRDERSSLRAEEAATPDLARDRGRKAAGRRSTRRGMTSSRLASGDRSRKPGVAHCLERQYRTPHSAGGMPTRPSLAGPSHLGSPEPSSHPARHPKAARSNMPAGAPRASSSDLSHAQADVRLDDSWTRC